MSEMIDKIARAMSEDEASQPDTAIRLSWDRISENVKTAWRRRAITALLTLHREVSVEMMMAGATLEPDMKGALIVTPNGARDVLRAMIDKALENAA